MREILQKYPPEEQFMLIPFFEKQGHSFDIAHKKYEEAEGIFNAQFISNNSFEAMVSLSNSNYGACYENIIDDSYFDAGAYDDQFLPDTATDGSNFLTIWLDYRPFYEKPYNWNIWGTLIDENGEALTNYGIKINTNSNPKAYPKVAYNGERYIVTWVEVRDYENKGTGIYGTFITKDGKVVNPEGFEIIDNPKPYWEYDADIACSEISKICLVSWFNSVKSAGKQIAARFIYADGSLSDVIEITPFEESEAYPYVSYGMKDGIERFLITWNKGDKSYAMRVKIDGTREDWPNGIEVASGLSAYPKSEFDGRRFLIVWWDFRRADGWDSDVYGKFLEPMNGQVSPEILISDGINTAIEPQLAFKNNYYLITWPSLYMSYPIFGMDIMGVRVSPEGEKSGIFTINSAYLFQSFPAVSAKTIDSNDSLYLVSWWDRRNSFYQPDIYYGRVKIKEDGSISILDPEGLLADISINHQRFPYIVKGEGNYLALWEDDRPKNSLSLDGDLDIYGAILGSNGKPIGSSFPIVREQNFQGLPSASYNPDPDWKKFMVIWQDQREYLRWNSDIWFGIVNLDGTLGPYHIIYEGIKTHNRIKPAIATADIYPYNSLAVFFSEGSAKGVLLNTHGTIIKSNIDIGCSGAADLMNIIWNGDEFFVLCNNMYFVRVDINGDIVSQGFLTAGNWPYIHYMKDLGLQFIAYECNGKICGIFTDKLGNIKYPPGIIEIKNYAGYNFLPFACSKENEVLVGWQNDEIGAYPNNLYYAKVDINGNVSPVNGEKISPKVSFHTNGVCESKDNGYIILSESYYEDLKDTIRVTYYFLEDLKIDSINPSSGCANGGFYVTITGTGFKDGASVYFRTAQSPEVKVQDCNTIIAKVPKYNEYQTVDVKVVNPTGEEAILPAAFTYGSLVKINTINPVSSPLNGGVNITVTGADFTSLSMIKLRAALKDGSIWQELVAPIFHSSDTLIFVAPKAPEVLVAELCVINPDCGEVCVPEAIGYYDIETGDLPFTPHSGITAGHTAVTFWGPDNWSEFVCAVKFGGSYARQLIKQGEKLIVKTPTHPEEDVLVEICVVASLI